VSIPEILNESYKGTNVSRRPEMGDSILLLENAVRCLDSAGMGYTGRRVPSNATRNSSLFASWIFSYCMHDRLEASLYVYIEGDQVYACQQKYF
jgi:hypothetical protein